MKFDEASDNLISHLWHRNAITRAGRKTKIWLCGTEKLFLQPKMCAIYFSNFHLYHLYVIIEVDLSTKFDCQNMYTYQLQINNLSINNVFFSTRNIPSPSITKSLMFISLCYLLFSLTLILLSVLSSILMFTLCFIYLCFSYLLHYSYESLSWIYYLQ